LPSCEINGESMKRKPVRAEAAQGGQITARRVEAAASRAARDEIHLAHGLTGSHIAIAIGIREKSHRLVELPGNCLRRAADFASDLLRSEIGKNGMRYRMGADRNAIARCHRT